MLRRRSLVRIISFSAALVLILGVTSAIGWSRANSYERYIRYSYQRSYGKLASSLSQISSALTKAEHSASPAMTTMLATVIWKEADSARALLGELPQTDEGVSQLSKYVAQVGAYAYSLAQNTSESQSVSDDSLPNLTQLAAVSNQLASQLSDLERSMSEKQKKPDFAQYVLISSETTHPSFSLNDDMKALDGQFPEYPALIYDGPFSNHIEQKEALFIKGKESITKEEARSTVAKVLGLSGAQLSVSNETEGKIPCYIVNSQANGGEVYAEVTIAGGHIMNLTNSRSASSANLSADDAIEKGKDYLSRMGYNNMQENYWLIEGNRITINFAYTEGDMVIYPDLIQIGISLDDGSLAMVQARGYIMNHAKRTLESPSLSLAQARAKVKDDLTIQNEGRLCLVPTQGENEVLCYEFKCISAKGTKYLIYINAATGIEEQFFVLSEDESGTLVL